jgi:hypothetical protein
MAKRAVWGLAMMILAGCQQQTPPPASPAEQAENALATFEQNADAFCPRTALRVHEADMRAREAIEAIQSNSSAAAIEQITTEIVKQITTEIVALGQICKNEKENCGTGPARLGMTTKEAIHTSWCFPDKQNTTETAEHIREQWVYPGRGYLYFDNDRLTGIQNTE